MPRRATTKKQRGCGIPATPPGDPAAGFTYDHDKKLGLMDQLRAFWVNQGRPGGSFVKWRASTALYNKNEWDKRISEISNEIRERMQPKIQSREEGRAASEARLRKKYGPVWDTWDERQKRDAVLTNFVDKMDINPVLKGMIKAGTHPTIGPGIRAAGNMLIEGIPAIVTGDVKKLVQPFIKAATTAASAAVGHATPAGQVLKGISGSALRGGTLEELARMLP